MRRIFYDYAGLALVVIGGAIFTAGSLLLRKAEQ